MGRARDESGFALLGALMILIILMGVGIALVAISDTQQNLSASQRVRESSFNLAEAALNAQALQLGRNWPTSSTSTCDPTTSSTSYCPLSSAITNGYTSGDYASACPGSGSTPLWKTQVRDNSTTTPQFWTTDVNSQPSFDSNGDGTVWVRAWATVQCKPISVVSLVSATSILLNVSSNVLTANWFMTTNQGKKVIVDARGTGAQPAQIILRCTTPLGTSPCANYNSNKGQVQPAGNCPTKCTVVTSGTSSSQALSANQLQSLEQQAAAASCPSSPSGTCLWTGTNCPSTLAQLTSPASGAPVVVQGPCPVSTPTVVASINSATAPGVLVIENGTFTLNGSVKFYGLIYMANKQASSGPVVTIGGNSSVTGAIIVDGLGGVTLGGAGTNLVWDQRAVSLLHGSTGASLQRGSMRVLPPSTP